MTHLLIHHQALKFNFAFPYLALNLLNIQSTPEEPPKGPLEYIRQEAPLDIGR